MANLSLVIWGSGPQAKTAADVAASMRNCALRGFIDDVNLDRTGEGFAGSKILGGLEALENMRSAELPYVHVAVGHNDARLRICEMVKQYGFQLVSLVHPFSSVSDEADLASGCMVKAGAVIEAGTRIGEAGIISANVSVAHDCEIGAGYRIALGSTLSGGVKLAKNVRIGPGSTILNGVKIGKNALIGAGSVVIRDVPDDTVVVGCPARFLRHTTYKEF